MLRGDMDLARASREPNYLFEVKRFLRRDYGQVGSRRAVRGALLATAADLCRCKMLAE
jgi:hypothetical protein